MVGRRDLLGVDRVSDPQNMLLTRSWPLLLTPFQVATYPVFKKRIVREQAYLEERFGDSCLKYRSEVDEWLPTCRLRRS